MFTPSISPSSKSKTRRWNRWFKRPSRKPITNSPPSFRRRFEMELLEDRTQPTVLDLTFGGLNPTGTATTIGSFHDVIFEQGLSANSTGTGIFPSFVQIQGKNVEQGYNYDRVGGLNPQFDEKSSSVHNHLIQLGSIPIVSKEYNGVKSNYYQFRLDLNESNDSPNRLISLDEMRIYVTDKSPIQNAYDVNTKTITTLDGSFTAVYDLDNPLGPTNDPDNWILLDAVLSAGSGKGDMYAFIPVSKLSGTSTSYVTLYSKFGVHGDNQQPDSISGAYADSTFEEWSFDTTKGGSVSLSPTINLVKDASVPSVSEGGVGNQSVTYTYTVTNTSPGGISQPLSNIILTDTDGSPAYVSGDTNNDKILQSSETWIYTLTTTMIVQNFGADHTNTATVWGTDNLNITVSSIDTATVVYTDVLPTITIEKSNDANIFEGTAGQVITYTYTVTNTSTASTDPVTITYLKDSVIGDILYAFKGMNGGSATLINPGDYVTFTVDYNVPIANAGSINDIKNIVYVVGEDDEGNKTSATAENIVSYQDVKPSINIKKSNNANIFEGTAGQVITYTYTVTNTSTATTDPVTITYLKDNVIGDILYAFKGMNGGSATLINPGDYVTFTVDYNVPIANAGSINDIKNIVYVVGEDDEGNKTTADDDNTVSYGNLPPEINVVKFGPATAHHGDTVTYTYEVTNTSKAGAYDPLSHITISDTDGTPSYVRGDTNGDGVLQMGETWIYELAFTLPTTGQSHTNTVTVASEDDEGSKDDGTTTHTVNFTFNISGTKFQDHDGNGFSDTNTVPTEAFTINVYADANGNGVLDFDDTLVTFTTTSLDDGTYTVSDLLFGQLYFVAEAGMNNWYQTAGGNLGNNYYTNDATATGDVTGNLTGEDFANLHTVKNAGHTIGYYSNKNGQATITAEDLVYLQSLNLVNSNGSAFDPTSASQVASFLKAASATNMSNMLSAQLIATVLNVRHGLVTSTSVYIGPGSPMGSFNTQGDSLSDNLNSYGTPLSTGAGIVNIADLIDRANSELALHPFVTSSSNDAMYRSYFEAMKDIFDAINNNVSFFVV